MDRSNHIPQPIKRVMDPLSTKLKRYELITLIFCNAILHFKMVFITFATAFFRSQEKIPSTPEDAKFYGKFSSESQMFHSISQDSMVARVRRIHQNDIENILSFSFLAFGMYLCDSSISTSVAGIICFLLFTFSRLGLLVMMVY